MPVKAELAPRYFKMSYVRLTKDVCCALLPKGTERMKPLVLRDKRHKLEHQQFQLGLVTQTKSRMMLEYTFMYENCTCNTLLKM